MHIRALALAERALLLDARAGIPHLLRLCLATVLLLAVFSACEARRTIGAPGLRLFEWLIYANFAFITVVGIGTFSSVIAEEKEDGTLGLLQLAGFSHASILLGKSIGQLLTMALMLVVQVPFALLAVTLGGCAPHQIFAAWVILLAHLLFVYAVALLASVIAPRTAVAARLSCLCLLVYYLVPWLGVSLGRPGALAGITQGELPETVSMICGAVLDHSALFSLTATTATGFGRPLLDLPAILTFAQAATLFLPALLLFATCSRSEGRAPSPWLSSGRSPAQSRQLPDADPFFWKDFRYLCGGKRGMALRFAGYLLLLSAARGLSPHDFTILACVVALDLLVHANRMFGEELGSGTLPLLALLLTPMGSIAWGKARACAMLAVPPLVACSITAVFQNDGQSFGVAFGLVLTLVANVPVLLLAVYLSLRLQRASLEVTIVAAMLLAMVMGIRGCCCASVPVGIILLLSSSTLVSRSIGGLIQQRAAE